MKAKYEDLKQYEGLNYPRKFIDESIHVRNLYEARVADLVFTQLTSENTWRNRQELYKAFYDKLKNHGFTEDWKENLFFDTLEEDMKIQYRGGIKR